MYFCIKYILLYSFNQSTIICTLSFFISQISYYFYLFSSIFFHKVPFIVLIICILIIFVVVLLSRCVLSRNSLYIPLQSPSYFLPYSPFFSYKYIFLLYSLNLLISRTVVQCIKASDRNSQEILIIVSGSLPSSTQTYLPNFGSIR